MNFRFILSNIEAQAYEKWWAAPLLVTAPTMVHKFYKPKFIDTIK